MHPLALLSTPVITVHLLALSVWVGSMVTIAVVARVSAKLLDDRSRIALFASVGRIYAVVGPVALIVALGTGLVTAGRPSRWSSEAWTAVILAIILVILSVVAMLQAHRMTSLRRALAANRDDPDAARAVKQGARLAGLLRAALGLLTLVVIIFEAAAVVTPH